MKSESLPVSNPSILFLLSFSCRYTQFITSFPPSRTSFFSFFSSIFFPLLFISLLFTFSLQSISPVCFCRKAALWIFEVWLFNWTKTMIVFVGTYLSWQKFSHFQNLSLKYCHLLILSLQFFLLLQISCGNYTILTIFLKKKFHFLKFWNSSPGNFWITIFKIGGGNLKSFQIFSANGRWQTWGKRLVNEHH